MITEALLHFSGIGPARLKQLHELGIRSWSDVSQYADRVPKGVRPTLLDEVAQCEAARLRRDIHFFVDRLHVKDKWRILHEYVGDISLFDIETDGLDHDSRITVIAVWHRGELRTFVEHENLDDFLTLLDDVKLLVSFNGSSFDVPKVLDAFHIPRLPCPHLDLRWLAYHHGFRGGLKAISERAGIVRPHDLHQADGLMAVQLWYRWITWDDQAARDRLVRYCRSDVLLSLGLAYQLAGMSHRINLRDLWSYLATDRNTEANLLGSFPK